MYDPTDITAELNRKTVETLQNIVHLYQTGQINRSEYNMGVKTLWSATTGLTSEQINDLVSEALNALKDQTLEQNTSVMKIDGSNLIIVNWISGSNSVTTIHVNAKAASKRVLTKESADEARETFKNIINKFAGSGAKFVVGS